MPSSHSHPANTQAVERPALEALNLLNSKLQNDHKYLHLETRIKELELERQNLYEYIDQLKEELELEKKLRSSWEKRHNSAQFLDYSLIKQQLSKIKNHHL